MLTDEPLKPRWRFCRVTGERRFSDSPGLYATYNPEAAPVPYALEYVDDGHAVTRRFRQRRSLMRAYQIQKESRQ